MGEKKDSTKVVEETINEEIEFTKEVNLSLTNRQVLIIDSESSLNEQKEYLANYKNSLYLL